MSEIFIFWGFGLFEVILNHSAASFLPGLPNVGGMGGDPLHQTLVPPHGGLSPPSRKSLIPLHQAIGPPPHLQKFSILS